MSALVLHHPECWEAVSSGCPWSTHWYSKPEAYPSLEACKGKITLWNIYSKSRGSNKFKYLQLSVLEDWVNITFKDTWIDRSFSERICVTFNTLMVWIDSTKKSNTVINIQQLLMKSWQRLLKIPILCEYFITRFNHLSSNCECQTFIIVSCKTFIIIFSSLYLSKKYKRDLWSASHNFTWYKFLAFN